MNKKNHGVALNILGKEYKIACAEHEKEDLLDSAEQLDQQMRRIRQSGKVSGADRVAVLAALNLTHELVQSKKTGTPTSSGLNENIKKMYIKIDTVLKSV
ncbi:MAG: cell division protein ZapA [Methyloprofundus sp.]|nr:MAG: cell division protein ZapA [Methyloprofundus sp.]